jgi:hypothetical protein
MHKLLEFVAQKKILHAGIALAILANPILYVTIGSLVYFGTSLSRFNAGFNTNDLFIKTMLLVSGIGIAIGAISKIASWILAFQKIKSLRKNKSA